MKTGPNRQTDVTKLRGICGRPSLFFRNNRHPWVRQSILTLNWSNFGYRNCTSGNASHFSPFAKRIKSFCRILWTTLTAGIRFKFLRKLSKIQSTSFWPMILSVNVVSLKKPSMNLNFFRFLKSSHNMTAKGPKQKDWYCTKIMKSVWCSHCHAFLNKIAAHGNWNLFLKITGELLEEQTTLSASWFHKMDETEH